VDALARAGKLRADQVIQAVQPKGGITLVQAQQPAFQFLMRNALEKTILKGRYTR